MKQQKKFQHNEIETCKLSKKKIDTTRENYSVILDCQGKEIKSITFYRTDLLVDLIKGNGEKVAKELMDKTMKVSGTMVSRMLENLGLKDKVYEIK